MDIHTRKGLRGKAADALAANSGDPRYTLLVYAAVLAFSGLFLALLTTLLDLRIANTGGLQMLSQQATLSTIRTAAPVILILALLGLELGRLTVALRLIRRQAVEPRNLLMGFSRFGAMLRVLTLGYIIFRLVYRLCVFPATLIYLLSPLSGDFLQQLLPFIMENPTVDGLLNNPEYLELLNTFSAEVVPFTIALAAIAMVPISYPFRMAPYCLLDNRQPGAIASLLASKRMTKGRRGALFLLDLSFWWFYLGLAICGCVAFGQPIAQALGISLPWEAAIANLVFNAIGIVLAGLLICFKLNKIQTAYAAYYEAIRPRTEPTQGGVVLGNIFDLAKGYKDK